MFPQKVCLHRWVEDVDVAERALQTASYAAIKEACEHPLTVTQLDSSSPWRNNYSHFCSSSRQLAPFLGQSLKDRLLTLMGRFIKKDVLEQADSYPKLAALDLCDNKNQVHCKHVEFGFAARQSLKAVMDNKTISELAVLAFKLSVCCCFQP